MTKDFSLVSSRLQVSKRNAGIRKTPQRPGGASVRKPWHAVSTIVTLMTTKLITLAVTLSLLSMETILPICSAVRVERA